MQKIWMELVSAIPQLLKTGSLTVSRVQILARKECSKSIYCCHSWCGFIHLDSGQSYKVEFLRIYEEKATFMKEVDGQHVLKCHERSAVAGF